MNKADYLGPSKLKAKKKTVMYVFWYNYVQPKCGEKAQLCIKKRRHLVRHCKRH